MNFANEIEKLVKQGEIEFSILVDGYPYIILVPLTITEDERDIRFVKEIEIIEGWLEENIANEYIPFPNSAVGRYKEMWQYVYFKNRDDAIRFKLVWG